MLVMLAEIDFRVSKHDGQECPSYGIAGVGFPIAGSRRPDRLQSLMAEDLVFMMGKFAARIPRDRSYVESHLWLQPEGGKYRVGFTAYSVRLLQDVYFLNWSIDPGTRVRKKQELGEIESSKALSTLYAARNGHVGEFNPQLLNDPSAINTDNYGGGWLYEFTTDEPLLTPEEYLKVLEDGWEDTQRMIKGQINE